VRNAIKAMAKIKRPNPNMNYNLTKYLNYLKNKNLSSNTIIIYQQVLSRYYGNTPLTTENITKFIKKLAKNKEPATCQLYLASLISYSKYLKIDENID
jgi:hypothetical protein